MTFTPLMAQAVREIRSKLPRDASVIELGNQRYTADRHHTSTKDFYLAAGFSKYLALDVNTQRDSIVVDLNEPVNLGEQFELVTNNGTSEHIFNQYSVFKSVHDLCVVKGIMIHSLPLTPWINHGFYNYNPILFRDLVEVNNYELLFVWISNRWGYTRTTPEPFTEKNPTALVAAVNDVLGQGKGDAFVTVAMRRICAGEFKVPVQGKYKVDIESATLKDKYTRSDKTLEVRSVLQRVEKVAEDPFPHVVVKDCLPDTYYQQLYLERPTDQQILAGRAIGENQRCDLHTRHALKIPLTPLWRSFIEYHTSESFWHDLLRLFGKHIRLAYPHLIYQYGPPERWSTGIRGISDAIVKMECQPGINTPSSEKGRVRGPHLDNPVELFGGLLYMRDPNDQCSGGDLEIYRLDQQPQFHGKLEVRDEDVTLTNIVKYEANTLVIFLNTPFSVHGVTARSPSQYSRKLVSIACEMPQMLFRTGHGKY